MLILILINERYIYKIQFDEIKMRFSKNLKMFVVRNFYIKVSLFALR